MIDVVVQVTKMGNTLFLDQTTGEPVYPFRLRRAPTSTVPGILTWPYQPGLELPEPFSRQEFALEDVTNIGEANREAVFDQLKDATIGWFLPNSLNRPNLINNLHGGANWPGAGVDPMNGMLYVTSNDLPWLISITESSEQIVDETKVEPTDGRKVYEVFCMVCHGANREGTEHEELTDRGLPLTGTKNFGGATVTAGGLVFATGARDRKIKAYDAESGEELWTYTLPYGGSAAPTVYQAHGSQYIVVPATGGGKLRMPAGDAFVAFRLVQDKTTQPKGDVLNEMEN